ncbi:MAG: pyruvate kinase [Cytophagales bacterium]|nr:pyruvate kinase [Cytophagales bacterium]MDW8384580.1 pyruvate kinase [Flammeovirgaceae bacterium]
MISYTKTKIIATVGPASNTREKLLELINAGVDVFRLNFSHGTHEEHQMVINHIKSLRNDFGFHVSILQDLSGPKMRIGMVKNNGVELKEGAEFIITTDSKYLDDKDFLGDEKMVSCTYLPLSKDVKPGDAILLDDGKLRCEVIKVEHNYVTTKVIYGGLLKSKKGINLPNSDISESSLSAKDRKDLAFGLKNDIDWIAISFVRRASDVEELKALIRSSGKDARVVAKIERPEALKNIDEIIEAADALMIARGDLGVEIELSDVPIWQKKIIRKCNAAAKPVIVATQMMESMIENARPTRAEAGDVANAVFDGADAVMLSAETASGKYPVETVKNMNSIIRAVEAHGGIYNKFYDHEHSVTTDLSEVILDSACKIARSTNARAIIGMTYTGYSAFRIARHRPTADILIFTANKSLLTILNLVWGVRAFYYGKIEPTDQTIKDFEELLVKEGYLRKGDVFVNTGTMPIESKRRTNFVKISRVE